MTATPDEINEWHDKSAEIIVSRLRANGYEVVKVNDTRFNYRIEGCPLCILGRADFSTDYVSVSAGRWGKQKYVVGIRYAWCHEDGSVRGADYAWMLNHIGNDGKAIEGSDRGGGGPWYSFSDDGPFFDEIYTVKRPQPPTGCATDKLDFTTHTVESHTVESKSKATYRKRVSLKDAAQAMSLDELVDRMIHGPNRAVYGEEMIRRGIVSAAMLRRSFSNGR